MYSIPASERKIMSQVIDATVLGSSEHLPTCVLPSIDAVRSYMDSFIDILIEKGCSDEAERPVFETLANSGIVHEQQHASAIEWIEGDLEGYWLTFYPTKSVGGVDWGLSVAWKRERPLTSLERASVALHPLELSDPDIEDGRQRGFPDVPSAAEAILDHNSMSNVRPLPVPLSHLVALGIAS